MKQKILLPGGSGFLGQNAAQYFIAKGYEVAVLTRGKTKVAHGISYINWDGKTLDAWTKEVDAAHAVINFTGRTVDCIYNGKNKKEIIDSRVDSVNVLTQAILQSATPPTVFVQAASLAIFGDTTELCTDESKLGEGFSVEVCKLWEQAFFATPLPYTRKVLLRIGFVLGDDGGALEPLTKLVKAFLGGTVGSGKQYISWLHIEDMNRIFDFAISDIKASGVYNATSTAPVTNAEFMKALRKALGRPWSPPVPELAVRFGAHFIMRTDASLALTGRNCMPKRLLDQGFQFKHVQLAESLKELASK
jgi:uncharacterized protein (TIGR01777 family)